MTVPYSSDLYQAVLPGGAVTFRQVFETAYGSAQPQAVSGVTITITPRGGTAPVLGPTTDGLVTADQSTYSYTWTAPAGTTPGDYLVVFTGTGPSGTVTYTQAVTVASPPQPLPAPGVYATVADFRARTRNTFEPDDRVEYALEIASEVIDRALIGAVYQTDADGMPVDAGVVNVFMRATVAQADFILANDDTAYVKSQFSSTSMSGVSVTRAASAQNQAFPPLAPRAASILHTAGVLPGAPLVNW